MCKLNMTLQTEDKNIYKTRTQSKWNMMILKESVEEKVSGWRKSHINAIRNIIRARSPDLMKVWSYFFFFLSFFLCFSLFIEQMNVLFVVFVAEVNLSMHGKANVFMIFCFFFFKRWWFLKSEKKKKHMKLKNVDEYNDGLFELIHWTQLSKLKWLKVNWFRCFFIFFYGVKHQKRNDV